MYYDHLKRRVRAVRSAREQQKAGLAILGTLDVRDHIAPVYVPLHADIEAGAHSTYNLPGGRGSCKSSFVSLEIVNGVMSDKTGNSNAIVFQQVATTLRDSVYSQVSWAIDILGVSHLWRGTISPMQFTFLPTGAKIYFRGLDDPAKLKSIKPQKGVFRYVWFEEFSELPGPNFLRNVMQSVQRGGDSFTVFRSFNPPISRNNWANLFIAEPDERAKTILTDYTMIPRNGWARASSMRRSGYGRSTPKPMNMNTWATPPAPAARFSRTWRSGKSPRRRSAAWVTSSKG